jgi:hypothetical protein
MPMNDTQTAAPTMQRAATWRQFDQKSAYVKVLPNGTRVYKSYDTIVALLLPDGTYHQTNYKYSVTTSRHLGVFQRDAGYPKEVRLAHPDYLKVAWLDNTLGGRQGNGRRGDA